MSSRLVALMTTPLNDSVCGDVVTELVSESLVVLGLPGRGCSAVWGFVRDGLSTFGRLTSPSAARSSALLVTSDELFASTPGDAFDSGTTVGSNLPVRPVMDEAPSPATLAPIPTKALVCLLATVIPTAAVTAA